MSLKATWKYFFPGEFNKFVQKVETAFDETHKREKKKLYLELKNEYEKLKKTKRNTCRNNNTNAKNSIDKKINTLALLLIVLEHDIELNESNMVKIYHELDEVEKEVDKLNISINTVNKGEKLLRDKIKQIYNKIQTTTEVDELIKNVKYKETIQKINDRRSKENLNTLRKRLVKLSGGRKTTRKLKH